MFVNIEMRKRSYKKWCVKNRNIEEKYIEKCRAKGVGGLYYLTAIKIYMRLVQKWRE